MTEHNTSRTITAAEVKAWFGNSSKSQLGPSQYQNIAAYLTRWQWPSDPKNLRDTRSSAIIEIADVPYWDFKAATSAAKLLIDSIPSMLRHWDGQQWAPETRDGYPSISALQKGLLTALPYIEWPFGRFERRTGQKRPKPWHVPAVLVAKAVIKATADARRNEPSLTRNSVAIRVVRKALTRMGFKDINTVTASAVAAHLARWDKEYGLTSKGIAALTTKQTLIVCDQAV